jgi:Intracellular proteinase inhibitor
LLSLALILVSTVAGPLRLDLVLPDHARQGEAVPITVRLSNPGPEPATVYLQGRPTAFDIVITRADGTPVWRRLNRAVISSILQVLVLPPGEAIEFTDHWSQQNDRGQAVPAGEYRVTGVLPTDPPTELRTRTGQLRILP